MILTLYPDCRPLERTESGADIGVANLHSAIMQLRRAYCDHRAIASIGEIEVRASPGAESSVHNVEHLLASFLHDMGNSALDCWTGAKHALQNMAMIQHEPKNDAITNIYHGTVVCIASGPSASKHFSQIRAKRDNLVVVCADSIYSGLISNGIVPDFVCMLERDPLLAPMVDPYIPSNMASPDSWLVVPVVAYPKAVEKWSGRRIWYWQDAQGLCEWVSPHIPTTGTGRSAGTMAVAVSIKLGTGPVYLVGHDLCRSDGESHSAQAHDISRSAHNAAHDDPLHMPTLVDGLDSCKFWELCRRDLSVVAEENKGRVHILGRDGLDIPGVQRRDSMYISDGLTPLWGPWITQSRPPIKDIAKIIREDALAWGKISAQIEACLASDDIPGATALAHPKKWAREDMVGLYAYVLGPIFRAASLRAHMRHKEPGCCRDGFRIITRTIPAMLSRMEREAC